MADKNSIKKIMIFAGEASGDVQGAMLARQLKKYYPEAEFSGVGGSRMRDEGIKLIFDSTAYAVIGAWEGIKLLPTLFFLFHQAKKAFIKTHPDLAIFIDTPSFNVRLARIAKQEGIKSVYYFPPSAWSGSEKRAREIYETVDLVVNAFKYSADTYDRAGVSHFFTGHPLVDFLQDVKNKDRAEVLKDLGLPEKGTYIGLFPGSRTSEINYLMPLIVETGNNLLKKFPDAHFLLPVASPMLRKKIEKHIKKANFTVTLFDRRSPEIMAVSSLIIMASGSVALEATILEVPMILIYKLNKLDYAIIKKFVKLKWAGLPNLILQREVIPELIQENATVDNISAWAEDLLKDGEKKEKMLAGLKEVNLQLGEPGIVERVARHIHETVM